MPTDLHQYRNFSDVDAVAALENSQTTWNAVDTSEFSFHALGVTNRCPSLAKECPGRQFPDEYNDVGFASIGGCCTLAATWFLRGSSDPEDEPEADIVINNRVNWNSIDLETVLVHEEGHAFGAGHSSVSGAVMEAIYDGVRPLHEDDLRVVTYLYPDPDPNNPSVGDITGTVTSSGGGAIEGATVSINDSPVSAETNESGYYSLAGVPNIGDYDVTVSARGHVSKPIPDVEVFDGLAATVLNIVLEVDSDDDGGGGNGGPCVPRGPRGNNCK